MSPFRLFLIRVLTGSYHVITKEEREESWKVLRLKKEIRQQNELLDLKEARIQNLQQELVEYYALKDKNQIFTIIEGVLTGKFRNEQTQLTEHGTQSSVVELSDENIRQMLLQIPKNHVKLALGLGDKGAIQALRQRIPALSEKSAARCIELAKQQVKV